VSLEWSDRPELNGHRIEYRDASGASAWYLACLAMILNACASVIFGVKDFGACRVALRAADRFVFGIGGRPLEGADEASQYMRDQSHCRLGKTAAMTSTASKNCLRGSGAVGCPTQSNTVQ
jgi:hypothetical protein